MVLQVLSDAWKIGNHVDAVRAQLLRISDSRQHQQSWRVDRAGAEHDFTRRSHAHRLDAPLAHVLDAHGTSSLDEQPGHASA